MTILWTTSKNYWIYKRKSTYVYEALTYYYETMTMASPTLHFQAVFQKKTNSPTTGYFTTSPSFIHELRISVIKFIEEILYWLDKHAVIEFTLTLTSCPFQIYLAESRMVGIQRVVRFRKVSLFTSQGFSIHYNHQFLTTKDTKRNILPFSSLGKY